MTHWDSNTPKLDTVVTATNTKRMTEIWRNQTKLKIYFNWMILQLNIQSGAVFYELRPIFGSKDWLQTQIIREILECYALCDLLKIRLAYGGNTARKRREMLTRVRWLYHTPAPVIAWRSSISSQNFLRRQHTLQLSVRMKKNSHFCHWWEWNQELFRFWSLPWRGKKGRLLHFGNVSLQCSHTGRVRFNQISDDSL